MDQSALPSRRTIAKSVAWATPVIAIGLAAPRAAASSTESGTLVWNNAGIYQEGREGFTFNYGFRSQWDSSGIADCEVEMSVDGVVVRTEHFTLKPNDTTDGNTYYAAVSTAGEHTWSIQVTAPSFNTLFASGKVTTD